MLVGLAGIVALWSLGVAPTPAVAQVAPVITSSPPLPGTVGVGYLHQFQSSAPDATFSVTDGALPPGLTLQPTGFVVGSPTVAGTYGPITVCASTGQAAPGCQTFTLTVNRRSPALLFSPSAGGPVGTPLRATASLVGAVTPTGSVTFTLFSDEACTAEVFQSTNVVNITGVATSSDFVPVAPGT